MHVRRGRDEIFVQIDMAEANHLASNTSSRIQTQNERFFLLRYLLQKEIGLLRYAHVDLAPQHLHFVAYSYVINSFYE